VKPAKYAETRCKSALNRVEGMPFAWSLNPYAGCRHGCSYCYARRYHEWLDRSPADFDSQILVKTNVVEVLRAELRRPSWRREHVALGTATDPYQPVEGRYRLTRGCLEAFRDHASPVGVTTKGTLIVRDLDVLQELSDLVALAAPRWMRVVGEFTPRGNLTTVVTAEHQRPGYDVPRLAHE
jgi:DNA repair photolyase